MEGPEWLETVISEAKQRVEGWPEGLRGPELSAIFSARQSSDQSRTNREESNPKPPSGR